MILDDLKNILSDQLDVDPDTINDDTDLADDLGADSLDVVDLVMTLEEEFDIEIPDEDIETMTTVGEIVEYISSKTE